MRNKGEQEKLLISWDLINLKYFFAILVQLTQIKLAKALNPCFGRPQRGLGLKPASNSGADHENRPNKLRKAVFLN